MFVLNCQIVRYENLHENPLQDLKNLLFFGIYSLDQTMLNAINLSSFENMQKLEYSSKTNNEKLIPTDFTNPLSFKTRSGKVGSYIQYFEEKDIAYIYQVITANLNPFYTYYHSCPTVNGTPAIS
jgi:hypothetical protein